MTELAAPEDAITCTVQPAATAPSSPLAQLQDAEDIPVADGAAITLVSVPAQTIFPSREELLRYVTDFSLSQGFAVVTHKSNVPRGQLWLRCDMGGASRNPVPPLEAKRKRKNSSRQQNCPYQLYGRRLLNGTWAVKVQNAEHTHDFARDSQELEQHPKARRLTNAQKQLVVEMTDQGIRPSIIVDRLKERFPDKPIKVRDIYNARNHIRTERRAGRVPYPECCEEGGEESAEGAMAERPADRGGLIPVDHQIQELWATMAGSMTAWTVEKKEVFREELQCLVEKFTSRENGSSEAEAEDSQDQDGDLEMVKEDDAAHVNTPSFLPVVDSLGDRPAQQPSPSVEQGELRDGGAE